MENRRDFLKMTGLGIAALTLPSFVTEKQSVENYSGKSAKLQKGMTILLQGDSITDAGRDRKNEGPNTGFGHGYAMLTAAHLMSKFAPLDLQVYNRGISGNKVFQLQERWQKDCLDLKPDVMSILIGVNDYWHTLDGKYDGTVAKYEADYRKLLQNTKAALPTIQLIILEPFALKGTKAVTEQWFPEFDKYRAASAKLAREFNAQFVPLHSMFEAEIKKGVAPSYWAGDGVHPSLAGAELMAQAWMKCVK